MSVRQVGQGLLRRRARAAVVLAALVALLAGAAPAQAFAGHDGKVVFGASGWVEDEFPPYWNTTEFVINAIGPPETHEYNPSRIYVCSVRTPDIPPVSSCTLGSPAVSPDGRRVAFSTLSSLAVVNFDGTGFERLPAYSPYDSEPAFSPSGRRLAFSTGPAPFGLMHIPRGIAVSDASGAHAHRLTAHGSAPAWSARNWIAFVRADGVYRARPDGSRLERIAARTRCRGVAWSPHGGRVAYTCHGKLFVAAADGSRPHRVGGVIGSDIAWSPSGTRFAVDTRGGIGTIRVDGTHFHRLAVGGVGAVYHFSVGSVDWQPLP